MSALAVEPHGRSDAPQLEALYRRYGPSLFRRCRRILGNEPAAHDALQEVFVRLMRYGVQAKEGSTLAWLNRVADRCCFDLLRKQKRAPLPTAEPYQFASDEADEPWADRVADREVVMSFLARLDARSRQIALHFYIDELDQTEIATRLGCNRKTVYNVLARLKKRGQTYRRRLEAP